MISPEARFDQILNIIANEVEIPLSDLQDDESSEFSELGIDCILTSIIIARVLRDLRIQLPDNVFQTFRTVRQLREHILSNITASPSIHTLSLNAKTASGIATPTANKIRTTLSVLIKGTPSRSSENIFLFPDGSGSAMAYARLPNPSPTTCLYALHSPYLQQPSTAETLTIQSLALTWANEIQRIQLQGPYILGGWSAGGYYTYEVMKCLHARGQLVSKILLIDSPCRNTFETLPLDVVLYLSKRNLMGHWGTDKTPQWLINHFEATLRAVSEYIPTRSHSTLPPPDVYIIWAGSGVLPRSAASTGLDLTVKVTRFLLQGRDNFGPNGWDRLFPASRIAIATMPGNHFNLVHQPNVQSLGNLLSDAFHHNLEGWKQW